MTKDDFAEWLEDPVTEYFLKYLNDSAAQEATWIADAIINGDIIPLDDQIRLSTLSITLKQIAEINFEEMDGFYKK